MAEMTPEEGAAAHRADQAAYDTANAHAQETGSDPVKTPRADERPSRAGQAVPKPTAKKKGRPPGSKSKPKAK